MNDTAIKNFCLEARAMLEEQVRQCAVKYGIVEQDAPAPDAVSVGEVALTELQRSQRAQLLELQAALGHDELVKRAAYTWFNRLVAIRFMEVNGYLPSGVRMLSAPDGSFGSQAVSEALHVQIAGIEQAKVVELAQSGDDEPLFRYLFLLQCQELAECLPSVFEQVGSAFELLLPEGLSRKGSVVDLLVTSLPETDEEGSPTGTWQDVEILGWMYQFYNAQVKDEFFKSKRKASAADLAPATQLFTPKWIVRYMVENSLGRLWMLNHPDSSLRQHMDYYIEPDAQHEDFLRVDSPEEITFCDPACGSGHILSYAFELLFHMYEEAGYRTREIPALILSKNLSGMEIDRRAAQIASLVLALRARQHDRRFFGRGVQADVCVLEGIPFEEGELACCGKPLAEALTHLGEVGSLLNPAEEDLASLRTELATCEGDLFANAKAEKLKLAIAKCEKLARRFDVVVANPPYMGLRKMNEWYASWTRGNYPGVNSDLYSCFMQRGFGLVSTSGYMAFVTMSTWMTDKGLLKLRQQIIDRYSIVGMLKMDVSVMPIAFETSATIISSCAAPSMQGAFAQVGLDRLDNARCLRGETFLSLDFCKTEVSHFGQLPDSIIAFNITPGLSAAFGANIRLADIISPRVGIQTGDTDRFVRSWWEISRFSGIGHIANREDSSHGAWVPYKNGGLFRKWFGNDESVLRWGKSGEVVIGMASAEKRKVMGLPVECQFKPFVSWSEYGLGKTSFRFCAGGSLFDVIEPAFIAVFPDKEKSLLSLVAFLNSSVADLVIELLMPGRHKNVRKMGMLPCAGRPSHAERIEQLSLDCLDLSKTDWDSFETSWDFKRHPLL